MNKQPIRLPIFGVALWLAAGAGAAPEIDQCMAVNATPSQFDLFVRTTESAGSWVEIFADAAGTSNLMGVVGTEVSPVYTGDPSQTTNYFRRADMRAIQDGADAKGLALHRISGCEPLTTYYCRVHASNENGGAVWPTNGLLAVTTELENDFVLESRQLLLQLDPSIFAPTADGAVGVLTATGAAGPIASFVGDGVSGNEVYFDLSSLFSEATHVNMDQSGITGFDITLYGPSDQAELIASFNVVFSNLTEVAMADTGFIGNLIILDIRSIAGLSVPPPGLYTNAYGTLVSCSVTNSLYNDGLTQHALAGWSLAGLEGTTTGATDMVELEMTNSMVLTWQWNTKYWLDTGAGAFGQVDEPDQWVDAGSVITLTALPDLFYHIDQWTGDVIGTTLYGDELDVPMTQPRSIFALFSENTTGNGVPQSWLYENGFTNAWETAGLIDHDNDGMLTWEEWVAGTSPTNRVDALVVSFTSDIGSSATLVWPSVSNRTYKVWRSVNLQEGFWQVSGEIQATPPANTYRERTAPAGLPAFYRISVER
ncbi:hypothetical protein P4C99_14600 [Pontiellaceae bacterium B1224]|nr:hypothetical protein [Pontiellaceae bacterium B1224]